MLDDFAHSVGLLPSQPPINRLSLLASFRLHPCRLSNTQASFRQPTLPPSDTSSFTIQSQLSPTICCLVLAVHAAYRSATTTHSFVAETDPLCFPFSTSPHTAR